MMKRLALLLVLAPAAAAQPVTVPVQRIADDAKVVDRVAEVSKGDLPRELLRRIVNDDIELLRGKRADGTYAYATYERMEASRTSESYSIEPAGDDRLSKVEVHGSFVYRVTLSLPERRMLVTKNRPLWIENVDVELIPQGSSETKRTSFPIKATLEPGASRNIDLPEIGRQTTVRVFARASKDSGYGNLVVALIEAKVFDNPDSPYADAVSSAKAVLRALDHDDIGSIRSMAARIASDLGSAPATIAATPAAPATPATPAPSGTSVDVSAIPTVAGNPDLLNDLQSIEDLLTGTESERRQGVDRLHQLIRKLRSR
jgi:hypothetical protein